MKALSKYHSGKIEDLRNSSADLDKSSSRIFYSRSIIFLLSVTGIIFFFGTLPGISIAILITTVIIFLFLLNREIRIRRKSAFLKNKILIHEKEMRILNKDFEGMKEGNEFADKSHPYLSDLDIFGRRSIFQLLDRTSTYTGRQALATWLRSPFLDHKMILDRQKAIKELSSDPEKAYHFIATGAENKETASDKEVIADWLNEPNYFSGTIFLILCIVLPVIGISSLILYYLGLCGSEYPIMSFLVQLMIIGGNTRRINVIHDQLSRRFDSIEKYRQLISLIEQQNFDSELLRELQNELRSTNGVASASIGKLKKLTDLLDARMNIVVAIVMNGFLLWDLNVMRRIEKWRAAHKDDFVRWINSIGKFDAYTSLAMYAHNNPDYTFPELATENFCIEAKNTGHPMISEDKLVKNDYTIIGTPKVDLLTGANMAGKSTFLRTIGVNLTLAMIGAPVCAEKYRFMPVHLFTSLRTNDSLQENESFFYAELKRLHQLVERYEKGERVFFLLDEILKGTNSKDQHSGSMALIRKIIKLKGIGIVATHDVELSKLSTEYPEIVRNLCFDIQIKDNKLDFSYKLTTGVCSTMNASFLMKQMGIVD